MTENLDELTADAEKTLDTLEADIDKSLSALQRATNALLTELDWNLAKIDEGYEFRSYETAKKFTPAISRPTVSELLARISKLFVYKGYLRLTVKDGERFWAVSKLKHATPKILAKELRTIDRSEKFASKLDNSITAIYLDENKDTFDNQLQPARFLLTDREQYKWGSGYVSIEENFFGKIA